MMKNKYLVIAGVFTAGMLAVFTLKQPAKDSDNPAIARQVGLQKGDIRVLISTTGVIEPQNRLEIKPPIDGRLEQVLVREGDKVAQGQVLAWMSSTDRAALLDAAKAKGEEEIKYWSEVYKATPLMSPIAGEVIVRGVEPGQTVTSQSAVLVVSDRLIITAQFDETDIGRVKAGQGVDINLDAYPKEPVKGRVGHIAYESKMINNVTIYEVDIIPEKVPEFFRSGMSANVDVIEREAENTFIVPLEALVKKNGNYFVWLKEDGAKAEIVKVQIGLTDGQNAQVLSGLAQGDVVVINEKEYTAPKKKKSKSPFIP